MSDLFLSEIKKGDKRIILINGIPAGAVKRMPRGNEIRSNNELLASSGELHPIRVS